MPDSFFTNSNGLAHKPTVFSLFWASLSYERGSCSVNVEVRTGTICTCNHSHLWGDSDLGNRQKTAIQSVSFPMRLFVPHLRLSASPGWRKVHEAGIMMAKLERLRISDAEQIIKRDFYEKIFFDVAKLHEQLLQ